MARRSWIGWTGLLVTLLAVSTAGFFLSRGAPPLPPPPAPSPSAAPRASAPPGVPAKVAGDGVIVGFLVRGTPARAIAGTVEVRAQSGPAVSVEASPTGGFRVEGLPRGSALTFREI